MSMVTKQITAYGKPMEIRCDGRCDKAWGINSRPKVDFDPQDPDDNAMLADGELGEAPMNPGTYEGGHAKPTNTDDPNRMNKWCFRECERCVETPRPLPDFTKRVFNQPWKHPEVP